MENKLNTVKVVRIGSAAFSPYAQQMKAWFKSWDSVSQANWIMHNPEDYVTYNDELKDGTLMILNNEGFNFAKYRQQLAKGA